MANPGPSLSHCHPRLASVLRIFFMLSVENLHEICLEDSA